MPPFKSGRSLLKVVLALAFLLAFHAPSARAADLAVHLKPQAEVQGEEIRLGDLADIRGPECALKNDLNDIKITSAPNPGRSTKIRRSYLEYRIRSSGLPLHLVEWHLTDQVTVTRVYQTVTEAWVREVFEKYLSGIEPYESSEWNLVSVKTGTLPNLPVGELDYRVAPANNSSDPRSMILNIYLTVDGQEADRIRAFGKIDLIVQALVAAKRMERGHIIEAGDVESVRMSMSQVDRGALTESKQALGLSTRHRLRPGQVIQPGDLAQQDLIERGALVTIVAESGQIKVTAPGQARRGGCAGESIAVLNLSSKKVIMATVVDEQTVSVNF
jgi:flagella basal body P-ring formation protein FlgA